MTTNELKLQVIGKINSLTDNSVLMDVLKLLDDSSIESEMYTLSDNHKMAINTAISQINNGDFLTNEQVKSEIDEWLNK